MILRKILRIKYSKIGMLRFIGHLDLVRTLSRAFARSSLPVLYSQGFSPHMKLSFGPSLPLGFTSECELLDIEIDDAEFSGDINSYHKNIQSLLPEGLNILDIKCLDENPISLARLINSALYEIMIPEQFVPENGKLARFLQMEKIEVEKISKKGSTFIDIRQSIKRMEKTGNITIDGNNLSVFELETGIGATAHATPALVIKSLMGCDWFAIPGFRIHRKALYSSTGLI